MAIGSDSYADDLCVDHQRSKIVLWCQSCSKLVCTKCISQAPNSPSLHKDHVCLDLQDAYEIKQEELQKLVAHFQDEMVTRKSRHQSLHTTLQALKLELLRKRTQTGKRTRSLGQLLSQGRQRYLRHVENLIKPTVDRYETLAQAAEYDVVSRQGILGHADSIQATPPDKDIQFLRGFIDLKRDIDGASSGLVLPDDAALPQLERLRRTSLNLQQEKYLLLRAFDIPTQVPSRPRALVAWCTVAHRSAVLAFKYNKAQAIFKFDIYYRPVVSSDLVSTQRCGLDAISAGRRHRTARQSAGPGGPGAGWRHLTARQSAGPSADNRAICQANDVPIKCIQEERLKDVKGEADTGGGSTTQDDDRDHPKLQDESKITSDMMQTLSEQEDDKREPANDEIGPLSDKTEIYNDKSTPDNAMKAPQCDTQSTVDASQGSIWQACDLSESDLHGHHKVTITKFAGGRTLAVLQNLQPHTRYKLCLRACNAYGASSFSFLYFQTRDAPPTPEAGNMFHDPPWRRSRWWAYLGWFLCLLMKCSAALLMVVYLLLSVWLLWSHGHAILADVCRLWEPYSQTFPHGYSFVCPPVAMETPVPGSEPQDDPDLDAWGMLRQMVFCFYSPDDMSCKL